MSIRPSVSAPQDLERRPSSSASIRRPLSSGPHRPLSAASHQRPASSASVRPPSRVSTRPGSRHSTRPGTRQSSRFQPLYKALVVQVSGLDEETDDDNFQTALGFVSKNLDYTTKGAPGLSLAEVDLRIDGWVFYSILRGSVTNRREKADMRRKPRSRTEMRLPKPLPLHTGNSRRTLKVKNRIWIKTSRYPLCGLLQTHDLTSVLQDLQAPRPFATVGRSLSRKYMFDAKNSD